MLAFMIATTLLLGVCKAPTTIGPNKAVTTMGPCAGAPTATPTATPTPTGTPCFAFYSPVTINSSQVPSTQTDYPVRIFVTDARLKTVGNGGHVENSNGYDIRPYSDATCGTAITGYELAFYDGSTGTVEMYVKRSSVSDGLVTYLNYGNASVTTDGSSTATWSNGFLGVYHMKDGTTLNVNSSTGSNNGTNTNGVTATSGQIDGAGNFSSGSSQYVDIGLGINPSAVTYTAWVRATSFPNTFNAIMAKDGTSLYRFRVRSDGKLMCDVIASIPLSYNGTGTFTLSTNTWYYMAMTYDSIGGLNGYVNATLDKNVPANGALTTGTLNHTQIGGNTDAGTAYFNGKIDEARISNVARSEDWIGTEYNEGFPATFETLGAEVSR